MELTLGLVALIPAAFIIYGARKNRSKVLAALRRLSKWTALAAVVSVVAILALGVVALAVYGFFDMMSSVKGLLTLIFFVLLFNGVTRS